MFVLIASLVLGLVAGYIAGGRLRNIESFHLTWPWLAIVALAIQVVIFSRLGDPLGDTGSTALHIVSYILLAIFVAANRRRVGVLVAGVGLAVNFLVISLNGGYMPASRSALRISGEAFVGTTANNSSVIGPATHLWFLGDVFAIPDGSILSNVFSVGDVLIIVGVAILIAAAMRGAPGQVPEAT